MELAGIILLIKTYNKKVEHFLLTRKWFDDNENLRREFMIEHDKTRVLVKKSYPKAETKVILGDIRTKYFGKMCVKEIIELLHIPENDDKNAGLLNDDDVLLFLSDDYRKFVFD
jgi:hypothetical protein